MYNMKLSNKFEKAQLKWKYVNMSINVNISSFMTLNLVGGFACHPLDLLLFPLFPNIMLQSFAITGFPYSIFFRSCHKIWICLGTDKNFLCSSCKSILQSILVLPKKNLKR